MNAVEIEEAISKLAEAPFSPANFALAFLEAFGSRATTIARLRSGESKSRMFPAACFSAATSISPPARPAR